MYFKYYSLGQLDTEFDPANLWTVDSLIAKNSTNVIYGNPGSMKTFCALDLGLSIANGHNFHSLKTLDPGPVVYLCFEGIVSLGSRIRAWFKDKGTEPNENMYVLSVLSEMHSVKAIERMTKYISELVPGGPKLVIVDTMSRCISGLDENSSGHMSQFIVNLEQLKHKLDTSVLIVHHSGKNENSGMRGSTVLLGACDTVINISKENSLVSFKVKKQKHTSPISLKLHVKSVDDTCVLGSEGPKGPESSNEPGSNEPKEPKQKSPFEALKAFRDRLSKKYNIDPKRIASDALLRYIIVASPKTLDDMKHVMVNKKFKPEILDFLLDRQPSLDRDGTCSKL